jgi:hypothetical protein
VGLIADILRPFSRWTQNKTATPQWETVEFDPAFFLFVNDEVNKRLRVTGTATFTVPDDLTVPGDLHVEGNETVDGSSAIAGHVQTPKVQGTGGALSLWGSSTGTGTADIRGDDVSIQANGAAGTVQVTGNGSGGILLTSSLIQFVGAVKASASIDFAPISAPASPASGHVVLYLDSGTGKLTAKESGGTTHALW